MKKKNGNLFIVGSIAGIAALSMYNYFKFKNQFKDQTTMNQYRNRLIEFFDESYVDEAFREMNHYIGFGLSPENAFELIVCEDKND
jgi:predicted negative regulator of RcsB-dependent stress response